MQSFIERVECALNALKNGKAVILTDHPEREDEGDLIFPAETITAKMMNFIIRNSTGIVCLAITELQRQKLDLDYMVAPKENSSMRGTPFTISIDAKEGVTTGVSAQDRVATILAAIHCNATSQDLCRPGHIFPLCAKTGGVLERPGHTEGSIDLVRLAGFKPAAVLCEIMNPDGTMCRGKALATFALTHNLVSLSMDDLIHYRLAKENLIQEEVSTNIMLEPYGIYRLTGIKEAITGLEHILLEKPSKNAETLVRIHSACLTGDVFGSKRCDCNAQLHYALTRINEEGGILIYLNQEGRGIGLFNKIKAYALQDQGYDTIEANEMLGLPADLRKYAIAANVLRDRGIQKVRLLTNNPTKLEDLCKYGVPLVKREKMPTFCNTYNKKYLHTKKMKLRHAFTDDLLNGRM